MWQGSGEVGVSFWLHGGRTEQAAWRVWSVARRMAQNLNLTSMATGPVWTIVYLLSFSHSVHLPMDALHG